METTIPTWTTNGQTPPPPMDGLEERIRKMESEKQSLSETLKAEKERSQRLEERLSQVESAFEEANRPKQAPVNTGGVDDRVERLAKDPDGYIREQILANTSIIKKQIAEDIAFEKRQEKAVRWLAKQEKMDEDEFSGSDFEKEIVRIVDQRNLKYVDPLEGVKTAYDILKLERQKKEKDEKARTEVIADQTTHTGQAPRTVRGAQFLRSQIANMSLSEFERNRDAILDAQANGRILEG